MPIPSATAKDRAKALAEATALANEAEEQYNKEKARADRLEGLWQKERENVRRLAELVARAELQALKPSVEDPPVRTSISEPLEPIASEEQTPITRSSESSSPRPKIRIKAAVVKKRAPVKPKVAIVKQRSASVPSSKEASLVEAVFVVGVPGDAVFKYSKAKDAPPDGPKVLMQYPGECLLEDPTCIVDFCMPSAGARNPIRLNYKEDDHALESMLYGDQLGKAHGREGFVFVMMHTPKQGGEPYPLYGCCVQRHELVGFDLHIDTDPLPCYATNPTVAPRVYCILSRHPFFDLHFSVLDCVLQHLQQLTLEAFGSSPWQPTSKPAYGWCQDPKHPRGESCKEVISAALLEIFKEYTSICLPPAGELVVHDPCGYRTLSFQTPINEIQSREQVGRWCISLEIIRLVGVNSLCSLLGCLLNERSVVIICQDLRVLSRLVLFLLAAISPLKWEGILLPVTPPALTMMMDAPVPFVMGIQELPPHQDTQFIVTAHVDLAVGTTTINSEEPLPIWTLPMMSLHTSLSTLLTPAIESSDSTINPTVAAQLLECCRLFVRQTMEHTDRLSKEMYVGPSAERPYYEAVRASQLYDCYMQAHPEEEYVKQTPSSRQVSL